jgi:hypothetical protein
MGEIKQEDDYNVHTINTAAAPKQNHNQQESLTHILHGTI